MVSLFHTRRFSHRRSTQIVRLSTDRFTHHLLSKKWVQARHSTHYFAKSIFVRSCSTDCTDATGTCVRKSIRDIRAIRGYSILQPGQKSRANFGWRSGWLKRFRSVVAMVQKSIVQESYFARAQRINGSHNFHAAFAESMMQVGYF